MNIMPTIRKRRSIAYIAICVFLFSRMARAQDLSDSLFEIRAQVEGYRQRIEDGRSELASLEGALVFIEMRKKKLALEQALVKRALEKTRHAISDRERSIAEKIALIVRERQLLTGLLQELDKAGGGNASFALATESVSAFFHTLRGVELTHNAVREAISAVREERKRLERQKAELETRQSELILLHELRLRQEMQLGEEDERKRAIQSYTGRRAVLFEELLRRSELASITLHEEFFRQEGVGRTLTLEEAFAHAESATKRFNIRPAFLLALVAQESKFGAFQGTGNWKDDMHPSQWPLFLAIMQRLGLDPDRVPVSKKPDYGWGGAMGPAQFLPGTWLGYEDRVRQITGHAVPSPWNIDDALAGAAIKLAEAGAADQTEAAERKAALFYFAGTNWENPDFAFYADSILDLARNIEAELKSQP